MYYFNEWVRSFWSAGPVSIIIATAILYWIINVVVYLITPVDEKRLELAAEQILDSLRTWSLSVKQTATLTNMKLYQSGVFLFGKKRRSKVIPLDAIDSLEIASGRNYLWLALCLATVFSLLYGSPYGGYYQRDPTVVTITIVVAAIFGGIFWFSGSRKITVRSKTEKIAVEAATLSMSSLVEEVSDSRVYGFANRIQSLVVKPRDLDSVPATKRPQPQRAVISRPAASEPSACGSCGTPTAPGSRFCEGCGIPVS